MFFFYFKQLITFAVNLISVSIYVLSFYFILFYFLIIINFYIEYYILMWHLQALETEFLANGENKIELLKSASVLFGFLILLHIKVILICLLSDYLCKV